MTRIATEQLRDHYRALFAAHGPSPEAVQWSSSESQKNRFRVIGGAIQREESLVDLGSGLSDLLVYLRQERGFVGRYTGLDLVPEFTVHARSRFAADPGADFAVCDVVSDPLPRADVYVASGIFNNRMDDNWGYLTRILGRMFEHARRAVVINALSTYVDYEDTHLYYCDPLALFDYAKRNLTSRVTLRHDYLVKDGSIPFEFTLVLLR